MYASNEIQACCRQEPSSAGPMLHERAQSDISKMAGQKLYRAQGPTAKAPVTASGLTRNKVLEACRPVLVWIILSATLWRDSSRSSSGTACRIRTAPRRLILDGGSFLWPSTPALPLRIDGPRRSPSALQRACDVCGRAEIQDPSRRP